MKNTIFFSEQELDRIIGMAWEDRTPFDAIKAQFGINESDVIALMRKNMCENSFKMWRKRVQNRASKHSKKRNFAVGTHKCSLQKNISLNKISKRRN
ncbi:MAG: TIGR03643 family protein [Bacteroidetes bacterium]|nr:MAG: TIGR03643 family protein [Bacteroidota bacterium]